MPRARQSNDPNPDAAAGGAGPAPVVPPAASEPSEPSRSGEARTPRKAKDAQTRVVLAETRDPIPDAAPAADLRVKSAIPLATGGLRARSALWRTMRPRAGAIVAVAVALLTGVAALSLGPVGLSNSILEGLGFDGGRAWLITGLIVGGTSAVVGCLAGGVRWAASIAGGVVCLAIFGPTFVSETQDAMAATGALGAFDPVGWLETLVAFVAVAFGVGWASATCAVPLRVGLRATLIALREAIVARSRDRDAWARPVAALLALCLLAVTLPVAANMLDRGGDVRMIKGGPPRQGLIPDGAAPGDGAVRSDLPALLPTDVPSTVPSEPAHPGPTNSPAISAVPSATLNLEPWKTSPPVGAGRLSYVALASPWVGTSTSQVAIYLPPGYDAGTSKYPVVYEVPTPFGLWNTGIHVRTVLDQLISTGVLPPSIYVFIDGGSGPYPDSQCVDSFDGKQQMDTFISVTVPAYVDGHYRTIAQPSARAAMGMSQGGYCAAMLTARHPTVFGEAVSFSGYFTAGAPDASSGTVFGGDVNLKWRYSPVAQAPLLKAPVKSTLYFVVVAQRKQAFYGTQAESFTNVLREAGIAYDLVDAADPHGWPQVRASFQRALLLLARHQAEVGVLA